jgi:hypothetical protein
VELADARNGAANGTPCHRTYSIKEPTETSLGSVSVLRRVSQSKMEFYFSLELYTDERCNLLPHVITSQLRTALRSLAPSSQACAIRELVLLLFLVSSEELV